MARRRFAAIAVALTASVACGTSPDKAPDPNAAPRQGGSATILTPGEARGLSPYTASGSAQGDGNRLSALYDVLVWNDSATGSVRPQMAESLTSDRDAVVWTLTLRNEITFTDGAALDAEAVKQAWEKHLDPGVRSPVASLVKPLKLTIVDRLRLRIELPSPNAHFDRAVANSLSFIPSPHTLASDDALAASRTAPVGAGPYKLREWVPGSHMTFERNPTYWQEGKPHLDSVTFRVHAETTTSVKTIDSGRADLVVTSDPVLVAEASDKGLPVGEVILNGGLMVAFNMRDEPGRAFSDPRLRRAVALSLSTSEINERFYEGQGRPAIGIFDSSSPLANIQLTTPQNDAATAAGLFAQVIDNGRKSVEVSFAVPDNPKSVAMAEYVKERVETLSHRTVVVRVDAVPIPDYGQRVLRDADFDMATYILWAEDPEPALFDFLHSKSGLANLTGYQNPQVDAALESARRSTDRTVRREAYTRVQLQLINDLPFFVYEESLAAYIAAPTLTGLQLFNDGLLLWDRAGLRATS